MKHNVLKTNELREDAKARARAAREVRRAAREQRAAGFRRALVGQLRDSGAALTPAVEALLDSAVSADLEIFRTSALFIEGRASTKAMHRLGLARSELRRALRALGLIANDGGEPPADPNAPPPGATDEERRAWSRKYVDGVLAEKESVAS